MECAGQLKDGYEDKDGYFPLFWFLFKYNLFIIII